MSRTIPVGEALGYSRMRASAKAEVITYLGAADVPAAQRRCWYREYCSATGVRLERADLDRVGVVKRVKEHQLGLLDDAN